MKYIEFYLVNKKHLKDLVFHRQFLSSITEEPFATYKKLKLIVKLILKLSINYH